MRRLKRLVPRIDVETLLSDMFYGNKIWVKSFFISFVVICILYSSKLLQISYATDDYARFFFNNVGFSQASTSGRWFADILNSYLFSRELHILPSLWTILSLFFFTVSGCITANIWNIKSQATIILVTVFSVTTPFLAHNLYFNTNVSVSIALFFSLLSISLLVKNYKNFVYSVIFLTLAIGTYQTVLQVALIAFLGHILSAYIITDISLSKNFRNIVIRILIMMALFISSYVLSSIINDMILHVNDMVKTSRLASATEGHSVGIYFDRIRGIYSLLWDTGLPFQYWNNQLNLLLKGFFLYAGLCSLILIFNYRHEKLKVFFIFAIVSVLPVILYLPVLIEARIPLRAHFTMGWFFALSLFVLTPGNMIFKNVRFLLGFVTLLVSTAYIGVFYDAAHRQTQADIMRASHIVSRIRQQPEYTKEPVRFLILGTKSFTVPGWIWHQQALIQNWSKYKIFYHFTDLNFVRVGEERKESIKQKVQSEKPRSSYPDKNSVRVIDDVFVLIL